MVVLKDWFMFECEKGVASLEFRVCFCVLGVYDVAGGGGVRWLDVTVYAKYSQAIANVKAKIAKSHLTYLLLMCVATGEKINAAAGA